MRRRDVILGGLALSAVAGAEVLTPRKRLMLLRDTTIDATIPNRFGDWEANKVDDLIGPAQAGRLARSLYSEMVARVYSETTTGAMVMMLAAYGDTQSDLLQLHRPESCYPAVGFTLLLAESIRLPIRNGAILPARRVVAATEQRVENIVYWTRMGETLPRTSGEQRMARLQNAMRGYIPDGILLRCSALGDQERAFKTVDRFVVAMLEAIPPSKLPALIGTDLARRIA